MNFDFIKGVAANLIAHVFATSPSIYTKQPGDGVKRAQERMKAKLEANEAIPEIVSRSRQVKRAGERAAQKKARSALKKLAMQNKLPGGAASV